MSDILNPVAIEQAIRGVSDRIAKGVVVCSNLHAAFLAAENDYERAYAKAYLEHDGAAHERKYGAVLATTAEKDALDVADVAYRRADRQARALESELRALQSVGASVRGMYGVAGRGES